MVPPKFSLITPFQQPNTLLCPACGFSSGEGPGVVFSPDATTVDDVTVDALQLVCTRCSYGGSLEWLLATAT